MAGHTARLPLGTVNAAPQPVVTCGADRAVWSRRTEFAGWAQRGYAGTRTFALTRHAAPSTPTRRLLSSAGKWRGGLEAGEPAQGVTSNLSPRRPLDCTPTSLPPSMLQQRLGVKVQGTKSARLSGPSSRRRGAPRTLRGRSCVGTVRLPLSLPLAMGRRRYLRDDDDDDRRFSRRPDSARSPPLPRPRSSPLFEPPRLDVRATLSAEAATRLMLEKWDLMDDLAERAASRTSSRSSSARSRQPKGRSSSLPPFEHERRRRISRVEEYERWKPERERIRLAQVEMERRLDEEKLEAQLVRHDERSVSVMSRPRSARSKVRERKATPAVLGTAISSEEEEEDVARRRRGRLSAVSSTASRGSPVSSWRESQDPVGKQQSRQETKDERRSRRSRKERPPSDESPPPKARSRSSRRRRPERATSVPLPGLFTSAPSPPTQSAVSPSPPPDTPRASRSKRDGASRPRTRSSRSRPRPTGLTPSPPPALIAPPSTNAATSDDEARSSRRSRSSRRRPRPPQTASPDSPPPATQAATASDLIDAAATAGAAAVEQVSEAVSSALGKMLPGLFGAGK